MSTSNKTYDVIIIGAGLSGLQAARTIQQQEATRSILILEARSRVGGRAQTLSGDQSGVDVGCSMLHGYYQGNPGRKLLKELGMDVHIPPSGEAKGLVYGDQGVMTEADSNSLFSQSTQMAYQPNPDQTENGISVAEKLFPTLLGQKEVGERLVAIARTGEIGAGIELEKTSAKWAGFEKGVNGTDAWPEGGYSEVVDNLVADYKSLGGHLQLSQPVVSLTDSPSSKTVTLNTLTDSFTSKYVISTIPLSVLQKTPPTFSPPLSPTLKSAISRTLVGNLEKIVLTYSSAWWPSPTSTQSYLLLPLSTASHPPSLSATAPPPNSLIELFSRTSIPIINFNSTLSSSPHPTLLAYIGASSARHLSSYSPEEIVSTLHSYLVSRFSSNQTSPPTASHVTTWSSDPFSLGATSTPSTITRSENGEWSNPLDFVRLGRSEWEGRLGFAGEHTVLDNHGSVAGALESGVREGERVGLRLEKDERQ